MAPPGPVTGSLRHPLTRALIALTLTTGVIDAVSFIGLGRVFTANMTGNVVLLGFGVAGAKGLPVLSPLISLGCFLVGATGGGMLARRTADRHQRHVTLALLSEVSLILLSALLAAVLRIRVNSMSGDLVIAVMALAMGVRNATVRCFRVPDLTTTVLTSTITAFAAESLLSGRHDPAGPRRLSAVLAMFLGALIGALLLKIDLATPLLVAAALSSLTWVLYIPASRSAGAGS